MNAVLSEKGQVTIPKAIRDGLGLQAGTLLDFQEKDGCIVVRKIIEENPISAWRGRGRLCIGESVDDYLRIVRGEA